NESREDFTVVGDAVRFGFGAVKGVGSKAIEAMISARAGSSYGSLHDFALRVRSQQVNRRVVESLVACGAFDSLERNRASLMNSLDDVLRWAQHRAEEAQSPQLGLFGGGGSAGAAMAPPPLPTATPWKPDEALRREREVLGFFITGHPLD